MCANPENDDDKIRRVKPLHSMFCTVQALICHLNKARCQRYSFQVYCRCESATGPQAQRRLDFVNFSGLLVESPHASKLTRLTPSILAAQTSSELDQATSKHPSPQSKLTTGH
ncbi:hypothetical protein PoB_001226700 [Plakobranchus ocellatus]|uniref:Uncharacterized protein n=1 Tax=Plakobranchus ocellatus TaxID=259542 RepID=A0AAV3YUC8_9GAST|nr:hypothetical protein PoB_001226700 [Plakobranchus ocellatus]